MKSSEEHFESQQAETGSFSDIKSLQQNASASVGELREFLGQLRGRSPQEVMGIVAQSSLFQSVMTATIGCLVILAVFTVGPYLLSGGQEGQAQAELTSNDTASAGDATDDQPVVPAGENADSTAADTASSEPDLERAADAMGISGTEEADPDQNPLDSRLDKLLDGIE